MGSPSRNNHSSPSARSAGRTGIHNKGGVQQQLDREEKSSSEEKPQKVFIIRHYKDTPQAALMGSQGENSESLEFKDVSLKEKVKNNNWKPKAKKQIAKCDQVIVAVGEETAERKSVQWEIREAKRQDKPIIPVRINSDAKDPLPENVKEQDAVAWKLDDIQDELDKNREERKRNNAG